MMKSHLRKLLYLLSGGSNEAPHISFKSYYPSIGQMTVDQGKFYKYWLKEWQKGNAISVDTSYIFVYIYGLLDQAIKTDNPNNSIEELKSLTQCYEDQVGSHVDEWIADIYEYNGDFEAAYSWMKEQDVKGSINRVLNLKIQLGKSINGEELIELGEECGVNKYKYTKKNPGEAIKISEKTLNNFKDKKGQNFLKFATEKQPHQKRHSELLFKGVPSRDIKSPIAYFNFIEMRFSAQLAIENLQEVNLKLKNRNQKKEINFNSYQIPKKSKKILWKSKIYEPFRNPNPNDGKGCKHKWFVLENHQDTYRKYKCIDCDSIFMCSCEKEIAELMRPHQISGEWTEAICPKCRGLDDTSQVTEGRLMYGSVFYAQHWREIAKERDRLLLQAGQEQGFPVKEIKDARWDIDLEENAAKNSVRKQHGVPPVGEGWVSETTLFKNLEKIFPEKEVIQHANPSWLQGMHLDVYIPDLNLAFEYQGRQHFEPVEFFGGEEAFEGVKRRDKKKRKFCGNNGIRLIYITKDDDFTESGLKKILDNYF